MKLIVYPAFGEKPNVEINVPVDQRWKVIEIEKTDLKDEGAIIKRYAPDAPTDRPIYVVDLANATAYRAQLSVTKA